MTHQELENYIDLLNTKNNSTLIFTRTISQYVTKAKIWEKEPEITNPNSFKRDYSTYFFIKNLENKYIGVVLVTVNNLHWFIKKKYRKKGFLTKALRKEIIPNIFYEKNEIRLSISKKEDFYQDSKKVAENLGFKKINETDYSLKTDEFDWSNEFFNEKNKKIDILRIENLRNLINYHQASLFKIHDELVMAYGECDLEEIAESLDDINIE